MGEKKNETSIIKER